MTDIDWLIGQFRSLTCQKQMLQVSEWAEKNRVLPSSLSSQAGPWRNEVTPYLVEIMDCFSETSPIQEVSIMKGTQVGLTTGVIENALGYIIDHTPGPTMYIAADKEMAEASVELKIDKMLASAGLKYKIFSQSDNVHNKKSGDTKHKKEFPGGFLMAIGPNSGSKLRTFSIRNLFCDELDAYPIAVGNEGDPVSVAEKRTDSFELVRKILKISTPIEELTSKIKKAYEAGDKRKYNIPCIYCGHYQVMIFKQVKYKLNPKKELIESSVVYQCAKCKKGMTNSDKILFLKKGKWIPTSRPKRPYMRSYHLPAFYSPVGMKSLVSIVYEYLDALEDELLMRTFINTVEGLPYVERGQAPKFDKVVGFRDTYPTGQIQDGVLVITAGADIQKDRIEVEAVGWCKNAESYSVDYKVFMAKSEKGTEDRDDPCWEAFGDFLTTKWPRKDGTLQGLNCTFVDSSYHPAVVYGFCEDFIVGVYPIQGAGQEGPRMGNPIKARDIPSYEIQRYDINTNFFKDILASYLAKDRPLPGAAHPRGFCHFPAEYKDSYFKQLTAEEKFLKTDPKGNKYYVWRNQKNARNEALDNRVYATAALYQFKDLLELTLKVDKESPGLGWRDFWVYLEESLI